MAVQHELKFLNVGVLFYLLAGALIFHSLGEFDADPRRLPEAARRPPAQDEASQPTISATDKSGAQGRRGKGAGGEARAGQLGELRLRSVRRMWNITNQLNILYEANWTELVLAELVDFERQLIGSLEFGSLLEDNEFESGPEAADEPKSGEAGADSANEQEVSSDESRRKKKAKLSAKELELKQARARQEARLKSLRKAFVHSLATLTTMGSPVEQPRSTTGKLATIFYGSLGIPLLFYTLARSGHSLARNSINCLLVLRHYCLSLPLHYLCCSCNLFACLRWLSWCCCCCCCSYLCCMDSSKQKCCDSSRAPKLKLAKRRESGSRRKRRGRRRNQERDERQGLREAEATSGDEESNATSFVIGFNVSGDSRPMTKQLDQQKSVRFSSGQVQAQQRHARNQIKRCNSTSSSLDDQDDNQSDESQDLEAEFYTKGVFATSAGILLVYIALGAYYQSRSQNLTLIEAFFVCYSMLATSKLPEAFELDSIRRDPFKFYHKLTSGEHLALAHDPGRNDSSTSQLILTSASKIDRQWMAGSSDWALLVNSLYILIGLQLIATCANFARLWHRGIAGRHLRRANCPVGGEKKAPICNGQGPSSSLIGSMDHKYSGGGTAAGNLGQANFCDANTIGHQTSSEAGYQQQRHQQSFASSPLDQLQDDMQQQQQQQQQEQEQQINLAELFVLSSGSEQAPTGVGCHSEASFAGSDGHSSSTAPRSLCVHRQSALALQALVNHDPSTPPYGQAITGTPPTTNMVNHIQLTDQPGDNQKCENNGPLCSAGDSVGRMQTCRRFPGAKICTSSSSIQLQPAEGQLALNRRAEFGLHGGHLSQACANQHISNSLGHSLHRHQHRAKHPDGFVVANFSNSQTQTNIINNNNNNNNNEQDSSPNTQDTTTNSQTMSSYSGRTFVVKRPEGGCGGLKSAGHEYPGSFDGGPQEPGSKSIWFSDQQ